MPLYQDQVGHSLEITHPPRRIVSLVPSQTELLYDLGLGDTVVGMTKFCVHPQEWFRAKTRIGGTKTVDIEKLLSLAPDLVIANKEENVKEQVEALMTSVPVWITDVNNLEQAYKMIDGIGEITGQVRQAKKIIALIEQEFAQILPLSEPLPCAYLIWKDPYMTVGGDTFINDMLLRCGLRNVFAGNSRYPQITAGDLRSSGCRVILLSSEPYPFKEKHISEIRKAVPGAKVILVDGEMFSWYGSRLIKAAGYFAQLTLSLPF